MKTTDKAKQFLEKARKVAKEIAINKGSVSADNIKERIKIPKGLSPNIMGGVFTNEFVKKGYRKSTDKLAKGRIISFYHFKQKCLSNQRCFKQ